MRETDLKAITFWLSSSAHGMRAWLRRSKDRIESLAGRVQMSDWEEAITDKWGIPRRAKAHRWEMQTKDEMAWWVPLSFHHRVIGYLELVFPSSLSADIELGTLRAREWAPILVSMLQRNSAVARKSDESGREGRAIEIAQLLIDCARRAQRPLSAILIRTPEPREQWLSSLSLRTSDLVVERSTIETLLVLPETTMLSALTFLTRVSSTWSSFEHVGVASLHEHGISLDDLIRHATTQPLWSTTSPQVKSWSRYAVTNNAQAMNHIERILSSAEASEDGKVLVVAESLDSDALYELSRGWEGIVVSTEVSGELPVGWSWVRTTNEPSDVEVYVIASDGTYGFKGPVAQPTEPLPWLHTSDPRLILHRWSQLTTQYLLGGEQ